MLQYCECTAYDSPAGFTSSQLLKVIHTVTIHTTTVYSKCVKYVCVQSYRNTLCTVQAPYLVHVHVHIYSDV
jgi:hypothetical protein